MRRDRRPGGGLVIAWAVLALVGAGVPTATEAAAPPNFVVIVADDLGYGDLGCYGRRDIRTPAIDRLASEGVRLTEFYTPSATCSPARAALLTGRHPLRTGVTRIFIPKEVQGLPASEVTLAELLKERGYATACIGKWHLGGRPQHRPQRHGFDEFYGVLYSNNMVWLRSLRWPRLALIDGRRAVESPADQRYLTRRYTDRAIRFLERSRGGPFFLYLAYTMPHLPLAASPEFQGRSAAGPYGDAVEEIDASVGQLAKALEERGLAGNTVLVFTSDNGPWTGDAAVRGGSTGGLRGIKGQTWEGGVRIPLIARAPGLLPAGEVRHGPATLCDILPTFASLAGAALPADRRYDGEDILQFLQGLSPAPARTLVFSHRSGASAVRSGPWKLHLRVREPDGQGRARNVRRLDPPQLFRLDEDPGEEADVAAEHPGVAERLRSAGERYAAEIEPSVRLRPFGLAIVRGLLTPKP